MGPIEAVIEGTLTPDGTLVLDEKPNLSPGRVTVVVRRESEVKRPQRLGDGFFDMMQAIWAGQAARNFVPRTVAEVESQRRELRMDTEVEIEMAIRLQDESRSLRGQTEGEPPP